MSELYESMFIMDSTLPEEGVEETLEQVRTMVTEAGGEVESLNVLGRKQLAFEIAGHEEGLYALMYFRGKDVIPELKREMTLAPNIIRHLVVLANPNAVWPQGQPPRPKRPKPREEAEAEPTAEAAPEPPAKPEAEPEVAEGATVEQAAAEEEVAAQPAAEQAPAEEPGAEEEATEEKSEES